MDEDEILFDQAASGGAERPTCPKRSNCRRRSAGSSGGFCSARLVLAWAARLAPAHAGEAPLIANHPATALALADDLGRLIDDMTTRGVSWDRLDDLVPDHLDKYWQLTLDFLKIARTAWPAMLAERGMIEAAVRRDALIKAEAARLARSAGPVIAAGSTGSIPATAALMAAVAQLPSGAVVLPGLDTDLDEETWRLIAAPSPASPGGSGFARPGRRPSAIRPAGLADALGHRPRRGAAARAAGRAAAASRWCRKPSGRPPPPTCGVSRTGEASFVAHAEAALAGLVLRRSRQCRGGSAGDRDRAARGARARPARPPRW